MTTEPRACSRQSRSEKHLRPVAVLSDWGEMDPILELARKNPYKPILERLRAIPGLPVTRLVRVIGVPLDTFEHWCQGQSPSCAGKRLLWLTEAVISGRTPTNFAEMENWQLGPEPHYGPTEQVSDCPLGPVAAKKRRAKRRKPVQKPVTE